MGLRRFSKPYWSIAFIVPVQLDYVIAPRLGKAEPARGPAFWRRFQLLSCGSPLPGASYPV
jgi:hypothetical protein